MRSRILLPTTIDTNSTEFQIQMFKAALEQVPTIKLIHMAHNADLKEVRALAMEVLQARFNKEI